MNKGEPFVSQAQANEEKWPAVSGQLDVYGHFEDHLCR